MSELERSLAASWDLDTLAVYADHLQRRGDPRGGLMALDLSPAPEDTGWKNQRQVLLVACLGDARGVRVACLDLCSVPTDWWSDDLAASAQHIG